MTSSLHTYGATCSLQAESNTFTHQSSEISNLPPPLKAHFFYSSALPIDDPLSPVPPPSSSSNTNPSKVPPRPFSVYDNTALEEAWQIIHNPKRSQRAPSEPRQASKESQNSRAKVRPSGSRSGAGETARASEGAKKQIADQSDLGIGDQEEERATPTSIIPKQVNTTLVNNDTTEGLQKLEDLQLTLSDDLEYLSLDQIKPVCPEEIFNDETEGGLPHRGRRSPYYRREILKNVKLRDTVSLSKSLPTQKIADGDGRFGASPIERDTTGTPFLRAPSRSRRSHSQSSQQSEHESKVSNDSASEGEGARSFHSRPIIQHFHSNQSESLLSDFGVQTKSPARLSHMPRHEVKPQKAHITVGISRLHVVELPELRVSKPESMKNIG